MDRREFVKRLSAGTGAALAPGVLGAILSGCKPDGQTDGFLTTRELDVLGSLVDAIIPPTDTPGARDAGVPQYIEMMLAEFTPADEVTMFRSQLGWVSSWIEDRGARRFEDVDDNARLTLLTALDGQAFGSAAADGLPTGKPVFFAVLKPLTVAGYYTSEKGATEELHQMPYGPFEADVPFDEIGKTWA